jgi:hypothetical protein
VLCCIAWQPLAFFSKKLNPAQQKYSAHDRELLAIYEAVEHFRHMLDVHHFVFTNYEPIINTFQQKWDKCSLRKFNHLDFIAKFTTDVRHVSGQDSVAADDLSRAESVTAPPSYNAPATPQDSKNELQTLLASTAALRFKKINLRYHGVHLLRYLYRETSAVHSSSYTAPSVPVCP